MGTKNTILYAEDEKGISEALINLFNEEFSNYFVKCVDNGYDFEKNLRSASIIKDISCIVTDNQMPVKEGLEVIRDNKEIIKKIPTFMFYSGNEDVGKTSLDFGVKNYFLKPNPILLIEEMKKYLK